MSMDPNLDVAVPALKKRQQSFVLRHATAADGAGIWRCVKDAGTLDLNSSYMYLMMADRFGDTCVIAERNGKVAGFVVGYIPPRQEDVIFVWQIGVHPSAQGHGLGRRILTELVSSESCRGCRFMETTVTGSNEASERLFRSFARHRGAPVHVSSAAGYETPMFPDGKETERLFRIGPFPTSSN